MSGHPFHRVRTVAFVALLAFGLLTFAGPVAAGAAVTQDSQDAEAEAENGFDENETEGTIDRVRLQLLGIAAVTGALLVLYIWHTDPQRRQRVELRRRDDRERAGMTALEEFVLPGDVDVDDEVDDGAEPQDSV